MHDPTDPAPAESGAVDRQFVTFSIGEAMFAVPMAPVQEIIRVPEVARLPLAPPALDGLANLRGRVLPILNLRRLFGTAERAHDDATRALVINLGQPLGFVVDRVASVIQVEPGALEPAQAVQGVVRADYLRGVLQQPDGRGGRSLTLVLDFQRLVDGEFAAGDSREAGPPREAAPETLAAGRGEDAPAQDELRLVSFTVSGQEYALDIGAVQEIVQVPETIAAVPQAPPHVRGLISLRQRLLPLVSLRSLFGLALRELDEHHRIVVVALPGGGQVGLVTDTVKEVLSVPRALAEPVPGLLGRDPALHEFEAICRLDEGRRLVSVLAADRLLGLGALQAAAALAGPDGAAGPANPTPLETLAMAPAAPLADEDLQVVIFRLGAEEFGVPIMSVQEIVRVPELLTRVPRTPAFVEGVINLRGTVLPVIDQRSRLGMPAIGRNDRQRIMVYTLAGRRTGFIVDSVAEVLRIGRGHVDPAPQLSDEQGRLITRVAKLDGDRRLVMLIDPAQLLGAGEAAALAAAEPEAADAAPLAPAWRDAA